MRLKYDQIYGKDIVKYLIDNKKELINIKKSTPIFSSPAVVKGTGFYVPEKGGYALKNEGVEQTDPNTIRVKVVANMANFADSYMDVLSPDCWKKSIQELGPTGKNIIHHLHDHVHTLDAKVGIVKDIYGEDIDLRMLGVDSEIGKSQGLIFETEIKRSMNEKIFNQYKNGEINQHSIGLQYKDIQLAVNDPDQTEEYAVWQENFPKIINKDYVQSVGYFWNVKQIRLLENSAVLFGANELTPTLDNGTKGPSIDTHTEPSKDTQKNGLDLEFINQNFKLK